MLRHIDRDVGRHCTEIAGDEAALTEQEEEPALEYQGSCMLSILSEVLQDSELINSIRCCKSRLKAYSLPLLCTIKFVQCMPTLCMSLFLFQE